MHWSFLLGWFYHIPVIEYWLLFPLEIRHDLRRHYCQQLTGGCLLRGILCCQVDSISVAKEQIKKKILFVSGFKSHEVKIFSNCVNLASHAFHSTPREMGARGKQRSMMSWKVRCYFFFFNLFVIFSTLWLSSDTPERASGLITDGCEPSCGCWDLNS